MEITFQEHAINWHHISEVSNQAEKSKAHVWQGEKKNSA